MKMILEVSDASDTSSARALVYHIDPQFMERILTLQHLVAQHELSEVRRYAYPERVVGRGDHEPALQVPEMCASRRDVWFMACDDDAQLQTRAVDVEFVAAAFHAGCETLVITWSGIPDADYVLRACGVEAAASDLERRVLVHTADGLLRPPERAEAPRG